MIVFVGDSFCSDYRVSNDEKNLKRKYQKYHPESISWLNEVGDRLNSKISSHGYAGMGWWYSWYKFLGEWQYKLDQIDAIVFCHTDSARLHNSWNDDLKQVIVGPNPDTEIDQANKLYYKYIHDRQFHQFAQEQYAKLIKETLIQKKTLHLACFGLSDLILNSLPGMVFTTPLQYIAVGGIRGTEEQIMTQLIEHEKNHLCNHFTPHNNRELGRLIANAIKNYKPGLHKLDLLGFNLPNSNYNNWPDGPWGTL